jgi:hypothetical protein
MVFTQSRCLFAFALLGSHAHVFAACEPIGAPSLSLSVSAAMVRAADRTLTVQVYDNGCVALHRPAFYRAAGDYRLAITGAEQALLRQTITPERLRQIDATELRLAGRARNSGDRLQRFEVVDADLYILEVASGGGNVKLAHAGLLAQAEMLPENADLQALREMVQALLALELRTDAVKVSAP